MAQNYSLFSSFSRKFPGQKTKTPSKLYNLGGLDFAENGFIKDCLNREKGTNYYRIILAGPTTK